MNTFIYALVDPRTRVVRYVGQSSVGMKRPRQHLKPCIYNKGKGHVYKWIKLLISQNLRPFIVILEECSLDELNATEKFYISYLRSIGCDLTNHTDGGEGMRGFLHSEETRKHLSKMRIGKKSGPHSQETIAKIAEGNRGKVIPEEQRARMAAAKRGKKRKPFSPEHKAKLAAILAKVRKRNRV